MQKQFSNKVDYLSIITFIVKKFKKKLYQEKKVKNCFLAIL